MMRPIKLLNNYYKSSVNEHFVVVIDNNVEFCIIDECCTVPLMIIDSNYIIRIDFECHSFYMNSSSRWFANTHTAVRLLCCLFC